MGCTTSSFESRHEISSWQASSRKKRRRRSLTLRILSRGKRALDRQARDHKLKDDHEQILGHHDLANEKPIEYCSTDDTDDEGDWGSVDSDGEQPIKTSENDDDNNNVVCSEKERRLRAANLERFPTWNLTGHGDGDGDSDEDDGFDFFKRETTEEEEEEEEEEDHYEVISEHGQLLYPHQHPEVEQDHLVNGGPADLLEPEANEEEEEVGGVRSMHGLHYISEDHSLYRNSSSSSNNRKNIEFTSSLLHGKDEDDDGSHYSSTITTTSSNSIELTSSFLHGNGDLESMNGLHCTSSSSSSNNIELNSGFLHGDDDDIGQFSIMQPEIVQVSIEDYDHLCLLPEHTLRLQKSLDMSPRSVLQGHCHNIKKSCFHQSQRVFTKMMSYSTSASTLSDLSQEEEEQVQGLGKEEEEEEDGDGFSWNGDYHSCSGQDQSSIYFSLAARSSFSHKFCAAQMLMLSTAFSSGDGDHSMIQNKHPGSGDCVDSMTTSISSPSIERSPWNM